MVQLIKIIIDTDPGVDDAVAILMALAAPEVEVVGLTTVGGNACVNSTSRVSQPTIIKFAASPQGIANFRNW